MSQNDRAAADSARPPKVDIDNLIADIIPDRERFTRESNAKSASLSNKMTEEGILPTIAID